jgi:predicted MPP superfamily phosphohydrolase
MTTDLRRGLEPARVRLAATGRGAHYHAWRGAMESVLRIAYAGGWPARLWARFPTAARVCTVRHELAVLGTPERRLRVAFASDLHIGPTTPRETLDRAFEALAEAEPDVLLLGGDYVFLDANDEVAEELCERVKAVPARTKLAVLGNHDLWTDHALIEAALELAGARVLVNGAQILPPPFDDVAVLGLDDPWTGQPDAERAVRECGNARVRIGLAHSPDGLAFLSGHALPLMLCGHTHGGQIALPSGPVLLPPGPYSKRYSSGLYEVDGTRLYVSRGIGATELPVRTYAPAEVAIFDLY